MNKEQYMGVPNICSVDANLGDFGNHMCKVIQN